MPRAPSKKKDVYEHPSGQRILRAELNNRNELVRRRKPHGFRVMELKHTEFVDTFAINSHLDARTGARIACLLMFNQVYEIAMLFFSILIGLSSNFTHIVCPRS